MTVKTLTYIHQLLIENEKQHHTALEIIRKARNQAEDENAENLPILEKEYERIYANCCDASSALNDFEAREW